MDTGIELNIGEIDISSVIGEALSKTRNSRPSRRVGASSLGNPCQRATYLKFHWAVNESFDYDSYGRFYVGDVVESCLVEILRMSGMEIEFTGEDQIELEIAPHVVCYPDGIITRGVPTAENSKHVLEIKSMNSRDFSALKKKGVKEVKPEHYAQMQLEMRGASSKLAERVHRALYVVLCKNLDKLEVYAERVRYDEEYADALIEKADGIISAKTVPEGISSSPEWIGCKMCGMSHFCHFSHESTNVNCRTCCHSTPEADGGWSCRLDEKYGWGIGRLSMEMQMTGCQCHTFNPSLVPYTFHEDMSTEDSCAYEMPDGSVVLNGYGGVDSHDLWKTGRPHPVDSEGNPIEQIPF